MKLGKLFKIQKELDSKIYKEHGLEGQNLLSKKLLALRVELGELANETRCFKYWSYKDPSEREKILEEFVDCIHFVMSIAIDLDFPVEKIENRFGLLPYIQDHNDIVEQFNACFYTINEIEDHATTVKITVKLHYMIENFLGLGKMLGFSHEDIEKAYLEKNKINLERLATGY